MKFNRCMRVWRDPKVRGEIIRYLIFGGLTTLVNFLVHAGMDSLVGKTRWIVSVTVAGIVAILFAYVVNRRYVFHSTNAIGPELVQFVGARLLISLVFEIGFYHFVYDLIAFKAELLPHITFAKVVGQMAVVVANYVVGKFAIFAPRQRKVAG